MILGVCHVIFGVSCDPGYVSCDPRPVSCDPGSVSCDPKPLSCDPGSVSCNPRPLSCDPRSVCNVILSCVMWYVSCDPGPIWWQIWCDVPVVKKARTDAEEEEELASRDMASFEVNYV